MSKTTRATQALAKLGVEFALHTYDYDPDAELGKRLRRPGGLRHAFAPSSDIAAELAISRAGRHAPQAFYIRHSRASANRLRRAA